METSHTRPDRLILEVEDRIRRQKELIARLELRGSSLLPAARDLLRCMLETRRVIEDGGQPCMPQDTDPATNAPHDPGLGQGRPLDAAAMDRDLAQLVSHAAAQDLRLAREFLSLLQHGLLTRPAR